MSEAPAQEVSITGGALTFIHLEALQSFDGLETGGILLGTNSEDSIVVAHAGSAGPNAERGTQTFLRDLGHAQSLAAQAWERDQSEWIGEWHTHPRGVLTPSEVDLYSYRRHLTDPELGMQQFIAIIVGLNSPGEALATTWIVERNRLTQVPLQRINGGLLGKTITEVSTNAGRGPHNHRELL